MKNSYFKGHGLGNDYIVLDPAELTFPLTPARIARLCDRERGIGSDGVLTIESSGTADFGIRIWNPDGSEAEISGNGIRIFARYLQATGRTRKKSFSIETPGRCVNVDLHVDDDGDVSEVTVQMGKATFESKALPCTIDVDELIEQPISAAGESLTFTGVSVGNPHCVIFRTRYHPWRREDLLRLGPALATHPAFPNGINLQLAMPRGPHTISILIWERGAGETTASGSSACAVASAAVRLGLVTAPVTVESPGGKLQVDVDDSFNLMLTGPVDEVERGTLNPALVLALSELDNQPQFT